MQWRTSWAVMVLALGLSACGGGGGGGGSSTPTPTPGSTTITADPVSPEEPMPVAVNLPSWGAKSLLISEVSSSGWVEIYNPNAVPVDVSNVQLRTRSNLGPVTDFALPAVTISARGYLVLAPRMHNSDQSSRQVAFVGSSSQYPRWGSDDFIELVRNSSGITVDFVRMGNSTDAPKFSPSSAWLSPGAAPGLPSGFGTSIVRPVANIANDTDQASDWQAVNFITPNGPNDVSAAATDTDDDGIPDSAEVAGGTFAGLDLYSMGARSGQRDIFLELDYMSSSDPGVKPRKEALDKVVAAFARRGFSLHIDAGPNIAGYNLGNSQSVLSFNRCLDLGEPSGSCASVNVLKSKTFDTRRTPIFHYAISGYQAGAASGAAGLGEVNGNDFNLTLGSLGLSTVNTASTNLLINLQASTLMHELGHNLGLLHGGFEDQNSKPNYLSIMNYLYSSAGLPPDPRGANAGQRWYFDKGMRGVSLCGSNPVDAGPCTTDYILDYSDGSSANLLETGLLETALLGRGSSSASNYIDWNKNGNLDTGAVSANIRSGTSASSIALRDYDDWGNLRLAFSRSISGVALTRGGTMPTPAGVGHDRQTVASEPPIVIPFH
ncbi:hypothetical protein [Chitinibacter tainanensis]|uniref:hypothetical protein n=1 Tax=Chitinibacter tainanensis TaxID=230667 RepID=UPI00042746C5|nr:hypothetical protein [Chitinibacter tainanensis]